MDLQSQFSQRERRIMEITYCAHGKASNSDVPKEVKPSPSSRRGAILAGLAAMISVAVALALPLGEKIQGLAAANAAATNGASTQPADLSKVAAAGSAAVKALADALMRGIAKAVAEHKGLTAMNAAGGKQGEVLFCRVDYFHNCSYWGKLGWKDGGDDAIGIMFNLARPNLLDKVEAQSPHHRWRNLDLIGWDYRHYGKEVPPELRRKIDNLLTSCLAAIDQQDRDAQPASQPVPSASSRPATDGAGPRPAEMVVRPGVGVGPITLGMSKEDVIKYLGKPVKIEGEGGYGLNYISSLGLSVLVSHSKGVVFISCWTSRATDLLHGLGLKDFRGATDKGIRMGAGRDEIIQAYGKADSESGDSSLLHMDYRSQGVQFMLRSGRLAKIEVVEPNVFALIPAMAFSQPAATQPAAAPHGASPNGAGPQPAALDEKAARALAARLANEAFARQTFKQPNGKPVGKIEIAPESFNDVSRTDGRWVLRMVRPAGPEAFVDFAADGSDPKVVVNFAWR